MTFNGVSLLLAGDALITRPWSNVRDGSFLSLIDYIRGADVAIANLETVIQSSKVMRKPTLEECIWLLLQRSRAN